MVSRSAKPEASASASSTTLLVGKVLRPHGLRGEVRVEVLSDVPERFDPGRELWLVGRDGKRRRVRIAGFRPVRGAGLLKLEGLRTRDDSEALRGYRLEVGLDEVPEAPEGSFYHHELIGCRCVDEVDGDLGEVRDVVQDGGGDLLELRRSDGSLLLVPFVDAFLVGVDVAGRRIDLKLPPGLIETCASRS